MVGKSVFRPVIDTIQKMLQIECCTSFVDFRRFSLYTSFAPQIDFSIPIPDRVLSHQDLDGLDRGEMKRGVVSTPVGI
jgi:hypothetical protein